LFMTSGSKFNVSIQLWAPMEVFKSLPEGCEKEGETGERGIRGSAPQREDLSLPDPGPWWPTRVRPSPPAYARWRVSEGGRRINAVQRRKRRTGSELGLVGW
jgi:hypothetical protein